MFAVSVMTTEPTPKVAAPVSSFRGPITAPQPVRLGPSTTSPLTGSGFSCSRLRQAPRPPVSRPRIIVVQNWFEEVKRLVPTK